MISNELDYDALLEKARALRREKPRARYAPSPTGPLHLGNARTALLAWLQARLGGCAFIVRDEDLDQPRVVEGCADQICADLRWLGLDWDEGPGVGGPLGPYRQTERVALYEEALRRLQSCGGPGASSEVAYQRVFRCYCSRREVRKAASAPHEGENAVYPGTCRDLSVQREQEIRQRKPDRIPVWRFRAPARRVTVRDEIAGEYSEQLNVDAGDFVLRRADDIFAYQLAVVVDDALMGVTDVLRGHDLLSSTPRQIALFEALGFEVPRFWHVPLMRDESGKRMSKRDGSESLQALRECGTCPEAVVGRLAASVGLAAAAEVVSAKDLLRRLSLAEFKRELRARSD